MTKALFNFIIIIILALGLSVIPVNKKILDLDFSKYLEPKDETTQEEVVDKPPVSYSLSTNSSSQLENPKTLSFTLNTDQKIEINNKNIQLNVYVNDSLYKSFTNNSLIYTIDDISTDTTTIKYNIDINKAALSLPIGTYTFKFTHPLVDDNTLEYIVTYRNSGIYGGSERTVENYKQYITLFIPDQGVNTLIPVNIKVPKTNKTIRTTLDMLADGISANHGLSDTAPAPKVRYARLKNSRLKCRMFTSDIKDYTQGSTAASFALDSLTRTMTDLSYVKDVQFFVDESNESLAFHGIDISEPYTFDPSNQIYYGLKTSNDKLYLSPIKFDEELSIEKVFTLLSLERDEFDRDLFELVSPIPINLDLKKYELDDTTLTLYLSDEFNDFFKNQPTQQQLMIDSIVASYTSLPSIDSINIYVDDRLIKEDLNELKYYNVIEEH